MRFDDFDDPAGRALILAFVAGIIAGWMICAVIVG
jgi:hypothetical protein